MPARDLAEWAAYERVYGPILPHDRIDLGLAQVAFTMARLWSSSRVTMRDFMPAWFRELDSEDNVKRGFEALLRIADADDL